MKSAPAWVGLRKSPFVEFVIVSNLIGWIPYVSICSLKQETLLLASIGETENPLAITLVSSAFFISVSVSIWIQHFPTSERRTSLHWNYNPHRFSTMISCGVSIWSSCIGKWDPVMFYLGTTELLLSGRCSFLFSSRNQTANLLMWVSARLTWYLGSAGLSWNDWLPLALWFLHSWMPWMTWMMLDSRSVLSVKYLLFVQEKYSWFTFYLGTIDFPLQCTFFTFGPLKFWTVHRVSIWAHVLSLRTSNVIVELLILAEPYILHSPYMWVSDRFHIYSIQK